MAFSAKIT